VKIAILANSTIDEDAFVLMLFTYMYFAYLSTSMAAGPTAEQTGLESLYGLFAGFALIG
jgi:hypothetical protein